VSLTTTQWSILEMTNETVTVQGYFGKDKEMTRDEFVDVWKSHTMQLHNLTINHGPEIDTIVETVVQWANDEFNRMMEKQA